MSDYLTLLWMIVSALGAFLFFNIFRILLIANEEEDHYGRQRLGTDYEASSTYKKRKLFIVLSFMLFVFCLGFIFKFCMNLLLWSPDILAYFFWWYIIGLLGKAAQFFFRSSLLHPLFHTRWDGVLHACFAALIGPFQIFFVLEEIQIYRKQHKERD